MGKTFSRRGRRHTHEYRPSCQCWRCRKTRARGAEVSAIAAFGAALASTTVADPVFALTPPAHTGVDAVQGTLRGLAPILTDERRRALLALAGVEVPR